MFTLKIHQLDDPNTITKERPAIELLTANGQGMYVACQWQLDRFTHEIGLITGARRIPVLLSCEGNSNDIWPSSPPLQQIHCQEVQQGPVLFGVGMSGGSHFSTSMLLIRTEFSIELQVESACSNSSEGEVGKIQLGSRFQWLPEFQLVQDPGGWQIVHQNKRFPTMVIAPDPAGSQLQPLESDQLEIRPLKIRSSETTQWNYRIWLK